jgi:EamA domain-containing membrane protein RarD
MKDKPIFYKNKKCNFKICAVCIIVIATGVSILTFDILPWVLYGQS